MKKLADPTRVLASPKFLPTDSDLCSSRNRLTDLAKKGLFIYMNNPFFYHVYVYIYIYMIKMQMRSFSTNTTFVLQGFFFFFLTTKKLIIPVRRSLTLKPLHSLQSVENHFGSVWKEWYVNKIENIECLTSEQSVIFFFFFHGSIGFSIYFARRTDQILSISIWVLWAHEKYLLSVIYLSTKILISPSGVLKLVRLRHILWEWEHVPLQE